MDFHGRLQNGLHRLALVIGCHQLPQRSYFIGGRQVPLCARCCGLLFGVVIAPIWISDVSTLLSFCCVVLFLGDGASQMFQLRESTNWLRFGTGTGFSASVLALLWRSFSV